MGSARRNTLTAVTAGVALLALGAAAGRWRATRASTITAEFHKLYHRRGEETYQNTYWLGAHAQKCPLDLWVFQEILYETRPDVVVEAGTFKGGSASFFASIFDLLGQGRVVTIDIAALPERPAHPRITYLTGSSTSPDIVRRVREFIHEGERVMVVLDSDHHRDHVLAELRLYSPVVTPGCYLIVEDTHFNGHPIFPDFGPGPMEAVQEFLAGAPRFQVDRTREKFGLTFNPGGYLKRIE